MGSVYPGSRQGIPVPYSPRPAPPVISNGAGRLFLPHSLLQHYRTGHRATPSLRTEQADFFFRIRSCECVGLRREKSLFSSGTAVGINLSPHVLDYFKGLADETGLPYQKWIDLYLLDCAKKRKKLTMKWVA